jgi:hypothetical protein
MNPQIKYLIEKHYLDVIRTKNAKGLENGCYVVNPQRLENFALEIVERCAQQIEILVAHRVPASEYSVQLRRHFEINT